MPRIIISIIRLLFVSLIHFNKYLVFKSFVKIFTRILISLVNSDQKLPQISDICVNINLVLIFPRADLYVCVKRSCMVNQEAKCNAVIMQCVWFRFKPQTKKVGKTSLFPYSQPTVFATWFPMERKLVRIQKRQLKDGACSHLLPFLSGSCRGPRIEASLKTLYLPFTAVEYGECKFCIGVPVVCLSPQTHQCLGMSASLNRDGPALNPKLGQPVPI